MSTAVTTTRDSARASTVSQVGSATDAGLVSTVWGRLLVAPHAPATPLAPLADSATRSLVRASVCQV